MAVEARPPGHRGADRDRRVGERTAQREARHEAGQAGGHRGHDVVDEGGAEAGPHLGEVGHLVRPGEAPGLRPRPGRAASASSSAYMSAASSAMAAARATNTSATSSSNPNRPVSFLVSLAALTAFGPIGASGRRSRPTTRVRKTPALVTRLRSAADLRLLERGEQLGPHAGRRAQVVVGVATA